VSFRYNAEIEPTCTREIAKVRNSSQTLQKLRTKATQVQVKYKQLTFEADYRLRLALIVQNRLLRGCVQFKLDCHSL
jgi:hypothetical protein